jgi:DNA-binding NtrC family response regulator
LARQQAGAHRLVKPEGEKIMPGDSRLSGKRILIVDDEQDVLDVLEELLDMCEIVRAANFEAARDILESQDFDIAILDIMGVDGYGLLDIAKKRNIPAVMLTAHAFTPENLVRTIKEGGYSYIPKEEIASIHTFLIDALESKSKGENPWKAWQDKLPSSYFEKRWGAAWKDTDKEFWDTFRASIKARSRKKGDK